MRYSKSLIESIVKVDDHYEIRFYLSSMVETMSTDELFELILRSIDDTSLDQRIVIVNRFVEVISELFNGSNKHDMCYFIHDNGVETIDFGYNIVKEILKDCVGDNL